MQFTYKGFDLSTDFVFKQGNYTYNYMWFMNADGNAQQEIAVNALDYWTATNTTASDRFQDNCQELTLT
jgi:hypothetical protein